MFAIVETTESRGGLFHSDRRFASRRLRTGATTVQYHTLIGFTGYGCDSTETVAICGAENLF